MAKNILVLYYTQSGQLEDILKSFTEPLVKAGNTVEMLRVFPQNEYPFPWTSKSFFAMMPDCVHGVPTPLAPFEPKLSRYDLVIFGYQAWFLSPSIPANSMLQDPRIRAILKDAPVITVTGARNMWISALERIKGMFKEIGAKHVGNVVLVDTNHNLVSLITILHWMFSGKRDRLYNIFPKPGVSDADIERTKGLGVIVDKYLNNGNWDHLQNELFANKSVVIDYNLMYTESKATKIFGIWAKIITKRKNRDPWLVLFKYYLLIALFVAAPIILTVNAIFFKPFMRTRIKKQLAYYAGVN